MSFFERFKIKTRDGRDRRTRSSERIDELSAALKERPGDWALENELADALVQCGRIDHAVTRLCAIGDRLAADGFIAKAHAVYKKALRLRPDSEYATRRVAELSAERINHTGMRLVTAHEEPRANESVAADAASSEATPAVADVTTSTPEPIAAGAESPSPFVFEPTSYQETADSTDTADDPSASMVAAIEADCAAQPSASPESDAPKTVDQIVADAEFAAAYGGITTAVGALMDCARSHPDSIAPVAKLAEIAATHGLDDVLADAEARLCDLHCRQGDYQAARTVAEALVMRYPDDMRHRARLMFVESELHECGATSESTDDELALDELASAPQSATDLAFQRALDALLACDGDDVDETVLTEARTALERAADVPRHRLAACRQLAKLDADAGRWLSALSWLENAAIGIESPGDEEDLAYEMAIVLERAGERDRALGVFSEIATKAGREYRDVSERIVRLSSDDAAAVQEGVLAS